MNTDTVAQPVTNANVALFQTEFDALVNHLVRTASVHYLGQVRDQPAHTPALPHIERIAALAIALMDGGLVRRLQLDVVEFHAEDLDTARNPRKFLTDALDDFLVKLWAAGDRVRA